MPNASTAKCTTSEVVAAGQLFKPIKLWLTVASEAESLSINRPRSERRRRSAGHAARQSGKRNHRHRARPVRRQNFWHERPRFTGQPVQPSRRPPILHYDRARSSTPSPIAPQSSGVHNVGPAGDGAKEIQAELPAGFVGDQENVPQCKLSEFAPRSTGCPANTAIGYTDTLVAGGQIEKGEVTAKGLFSHAATASTNSLVYNLEPSAGHPAAFGFHAVIPFIFEAQLRSDADYGVTVGDSAVGEKPLGTEITISRTERAERRRSFTATPSRRAERNPT